MATLKFHQIFMLFSILILYSCRKDDFIEYRGDVLGTYTIIKTRNDWIEQTHFYEQDTFEMTITKVADSFVVVKGDLFLDFPNSYKVNPDRTVSWSKTSNWPHKYLSIHNEEFHASTSNNYTLGASLNTTYNGYKEP